MASNSETKITNKLVLVVASTLPDSIDPSFRRGGRLDVEIEIGVPTANARRDIFCKIIEEMKTEVPRYSELSPDDMKYISDSAHGYVGADLRSLCCHAQTILSSQSISTYSNDQAGRRSLFLKA